MKESRNCWKRTTRCLPINFLHVGCRGAIWITRSSWRKYVSLFIVLCIDCHSLNCSLPRWCRAKTQERYDQAKSFKLRCATLFVKDGHTRLRGFVDYWALNRISKRTCLHSLYAMKCSTVWLELNVSRNLTWRLVSTKSGTNQTISELQSSVQKKSNMSLWVWKWGISMLLRRFRLQWTKFSTIALMFPWWYIWTICLFSANPSELICATWKRCCTDISNMMYIFSFKV